MDVRFGMIFTSPPDFGGIERSGKGFILMSDDLSRLTGTLTRAVCKPLLKSGSIWNVTPGTKAYVLDTREIYIYYPDDKWHHFREWKNPGKVRAGYVQLHISKDNAPYVLGDEENIKITVKVKKFFADSDELTTVLDEVMITRDNYTENGYYVLYLNLGQAVNFVWCEYYRLNYSLHVAAEEGETQEEVESRFGVRWDLTQWVDEVLK